MMPLGGASRSTLRVPGSPRLAVTEYAPSKNFVISSRRSESSSMMVKRFLALPGTGTSREVVRLV